MQQGYGLGQPTSTLEHQAQESVAECGDNCICMQLDGFDIIPLLKKDCYGRGLVTKLLQVVVN